jgi:Metal-dependent proteases with possible chaperone activity
MRENTVLKPYVRYFFLLAFAASLVTGCSSYQPTKNVWKSTKALWNTYVSPPATVDLDEKGTLSPQALSLTQSMLCLGIESSCDETALALVEDGRLVEAVLASQANLHALFGGVVPELASREHYRFIGPLFDELMKRCGKPASQIDMVAVSRGPGLLGSLLVGVAFAKGLALGLGKPLLGVNHLHEKVWSGLAPLRVYCRHL